jgi:hypothetical protein
MRVDGPGLERVFDRARQRGHGVVGALDVLEAARFGAGEGWLGCGTRDAWVAIGALVCLDRLLDDESTVDVGARAQRLPGSRETLGGPAVSIARRRYRLSLPMAEVVDRARAASRAHRFGGVTVAMVIGSIVMGDSPVADRMRATAGSVDLPMAVAQALGDPALSIMVGLMVDPAGTRSAIGAVALRIGGWTVAAAGVAVAAVPLLGIGLVFFAGGATNLVYPFATLGVLVAGAAIRAGGRFRATSRRRLAANAVHALVADPRAPVLYLRSFDTDRAVGHVGESGSEARFSGVPLATSTNLAQTRYTEEEQLAHALSHIGPVIAIGRPGEAMPFGGAARLYVGPAAWQGVVIDLLSRSSLVVIGFTGNPGVLWELREALDRVDPARLVLLITTGVADYDKTRERTAELFRVPLPVPVVVSAGYHTTIRGAILFADDWTPSIVPFAQPGTAPRMPVEWGCVQALRPTFERIGGRWPGRRWRYRLRGYLQYTAVVGLLAATLLALLIAVLITSAP